MGVGFVGPSGNVGSSSESETSTTSTHSSFQAESEKSNSFWGIHNDGIGANELARIERSLGADISQAMEKPDEHFVSCRQISIFDQLVRRSWTYQKQ